MRHRFLAFHRPRVAGRHRFLEGLRLLLLLFLTLTVYGAGHGGEDEGCWVLWESVAAEADADA